tara:strand:- start:479 stop:1534 length:1056 start_codon:yes stop_codon:yes gene_type:complete
MRKIITLILFFILIFVYYQGKTERFSDYNIFKLLDLSIKSDQEVPDSDITVTTQIIPTTQSDSQQNVPIYTTMSLDDQNDSETSSTTAVTNQDNQTTAASNQGGQGGSSSTTSASSSGSGGGGGGGSSPSTTSASSSGSGSGGGGGGSSNLPVCGLYNGSEYVYNQDCGTPDKYYGNWGTNTFSWCNEQDQVQIDGTIQQCTYLGCKDTSNTSNFELKIGNDYCVPFCQSNPGQGSTITDFNNGCSSSGSTTSASSSGGGGGGSPFCAYYNNGQYIPYETECGIPAAASWSDGAGAYEKCTGSSCSDVRCFKDNVLQQTVKVGQDGVSCIPICNNGSSPSVNGTNISCGQV